MNADKSMHQILCGGISFGLLMLMLVLGLPFLSAATDIADLQLEGLLDQIVLSASKHAETLEDSPANVFLISREMIQDYDFQSVGEALSIVPGMYVSDDYSLSQVGVRGVASFGDWNTRVMVLVDGRPTVEQYGGTNAVDLPGVEMEHIDRIEVIKGPASSLYGSAAFCGIVNIITRNAADNGVDISSSYHADTDTRKVSGLLRRNFSKDVWFQSLTSYRKRIGNDLYFPEFSDITDPDIFRLDADGLNQYYLDSESFTAGYSSDMNSQEMFSTHNTVRWNKFYITGHYAKLTTGAAQVLWGSLFNRPENGFEERRAYLDIVYANDLTPSLNMQAKLSYDDFMWADYIMYNYYSEEDDPLYLPGPLWIDWESDRFVSSEAKFTKTIDDRNSLLVGGEVQFHNIRQESGEADAGLEEIAENVILDEVVENNGQIYNLYAQYERRQSDKIKLVGGLHYDYCSYTTGRLTPKGALVVKPYRSGTYKVIASQGFRSPSFYELTFDDGYYYVRNPELKPELISSYEFISAHEFPYGFTAEVAANYSRLTDMILQTVVDTSDPAHPGGDYIDEVTQFRNVGSMSTTSLEICVRRSPIYRLSGFGSLTYQDVDILDEAQSSDAVNSPHWLLSLGLTYQIKRNAARVSTIWRHVSSRMLWDGSRMDAETVGDVQLSFTKLLRVADLSMGVKNVFDVSYGMPISWDYAPSAQIQRPGRSIFVKVESWLGW